MMQGTGLNEAMMARHPAYPVILRRAAELAVRDEAHELGRGATKQELVDEVERLMPGRYSPATLKSYVRAMVRFGLLQARGEAQMRRYLPPKAPATDG